LSKCLCRHQADVYHAYQVLKRGGLDDDHIVVMHTNDLVGNFMNPHPGQVFNQPGGPDVYDGVPLVGVSSTQGIPPFPGKLSVGIHTPRRVCSWGKRDGRQGELVGGVWSKG